MRYDPDDCLHADEDCEYCVPDETVDPGEVTEDVCPPHCPNYRPRGRRTLDPDAATRAGVPLDTPAPTGPCPFAGTAPWANHGNRKNRKRRHRR